MKDVLKVSIRDVIYDLPIEFNWCINDECEIIFMWQNKSIKIIDRSFFHALLKFRKRIRRRIFLCDGTRNARFLCNGSRKDVWPSGSGVQINGGLDSYVHEIGKPCTEKVGIFDFYNGNLVVTPFEQEQFHREYWKELKRAIKEETHNRINPDKPGHHEFGTNKVFRLQIINFEVYFLKLSSQKIQKVWLNS